jgi:hypothetical protein
MTKLPCPRDAGIVPQMQLINVIMHNYRSKDKSHIIISIDAEKVFDKVQHILMMKALRKLGIEEIYFNIINAIYDKPIANIILNREKLKPFPLNSGMRQGAHFTTDIQHRPRIPSQSSKARRRNKIIQSR